MKTARLLVVGQTGSSNIGGSFIRAAVEMGLRAELCDTAKAWRHGTAVQKLLWQFCGRRPIALRQFSQSVINRCRAFRPSILLSTGAAPLDVESLNVCRSLGTRCINFSTDDPFNPLMRAPWFLRALPAYDTVFSPRQVNLTELRAHGCRDVRYLPFGYDPELFVAEPGQTDDLSDLFFAGTAEQSRVNYITCAIKAGLSVRLHGQYWDRYPATRPFARGHADIPTLRRGIASCKLALCLVRHDNRDGHSMRTFELPAVGACMLVEDSAEHRTIFGEDGERVSFFRSSSEMLDKARTLLEDTAKRAKLRDAAQSHILAGRNTYADRLAEMLSS